MHAVLEILTLVGLIQQLICSHKKYILTLLIFYINLSNFFG